MRITIIGEWIYPYATPRSFRTFELAKQLAKQHDVTVYALLGKYDYSQIENETGLKIKTIGKSRCGNIDCDGNHRRTLLWGGLARLFGRQLQLPHIELIPLVKKVALREKDNTDLIISIAKPYSIHFGVMQAKRESKNFPVWISDCGDPFMGVPFSAPPFYFRRFEKEWGRLTDVITIPIEKAREAYFDEVQNKIRIVPQGFNLEEANGLTYKENKILTFIFAGNVIYEQRDPAKFLEYLSKKNIDFKFIVYTRCLQYFEEYKRIFGNKIEVYDFIPREQLMNKLAAADFLVNIQNKGSVQSPSKLIDYTLANRPILEITTDFRESEIVDEFLSRNYEHAMPKIDISQYDIKNIAQKFIDLSGLEK